MKLALDVIRGLARAVIAICDLIENTHKAGPTDPKPEPKPDDPDKPKEPTL